MEQEESKYYTPDISSFYIGYQYETFIARWTEYMKDESFWQKKIFSEPLMYGNVLSSHIKDNHIKVAYLTNEQILAEGWEVEGIFPNDAVVFVKGDEMNGYELLYHNKRMKITKFKSIWQGDDSFKKLTDCIFNGNIPSINEFRYITKLLNIK